MAKRFFDSNKFRNKWYRNLTPKQKCIWEFFLCECNHAGILELDFQSMSFHIGTDIKETDISFLKNKTVKIKDSKIFIPKFIEFQYKTLSENCKPHIPVILELKKYNLFKGYAKGMYTLKDKDKEKEQVKEKVKDKEIDLSFIADEKFKEVFKKWLDYKKERGESYKPMGLKSAYNKLIKFSGGKSDIADKIIEQAMSNNYSGFFELKEGFNNGSKKLTEKDGFYG